VTAAQSLDSLIAPLIEAVHDGVVEVYNEFSLQHELGIFLRGNRGNSVVQFERNIKHFFPAIAPDAFTKREIDIAIYTAKQPRVLEWAIELKFPRNGQHPEQMFSFCIRTGNSFAARELWSLVALTLQKRTSRFRPVCISMFPSGATAPQNTLHGSMPFSGGNRKKRVSMWTTKSFLWSW
jgi:hypothetical protein